MASDNLGVAMMATAELLDYQSLAPGSRIDVETRSRHYYIECLGGSSVRISGHPEYCPEPVAARLEGSIDQEGSLEAGYIGRGMRLMFLVNDQRSVTTSRILKVRVSQPDPSASVH